MRLFRWGVVVALLALLPVGSFAYTGQGAVWAMKTGVFVAKNFAGDDTGIQAAIDYCAPTGGTVQVSAGRYSITQSIRMDSPGVNLSAYSDSVVFQNAGAGNGDTLLIIMGDNCTVKGISFDGRKNIKSDGYGIHVEAENVTLDKLWIYNTPDAAIHVHQGSHNVTVQDCLIEYPGDVTATGGDGIIIHDSDNSKVMNNRVVGAKRYGIWTQGTSRDGVISGNTVKDCGDDGINTAAAGSAFNIIGNTCIGNLDDGIEPDSDSTNVSNNIVMRSPHFGIWSEDGGNGSSWWGNLCAYNGNYNMGLKNTTLDTLSGWAIFSNFLIRPYGQQFEIESTGSGSYIRDVQFANNYLIGPTMTQAGNSHPALKLVASNGARIERVHYMGNVVKDPTSYGFWATPISAGQIHDLVITGNHFVGGRYGIKLDAGATGNTGYVASNYYQSQTVGQESVSTFWEVGFASGKVYDHSWKTIVEDSLRVNGPTVLLGPVTMAALADLITTGKVVGEDSLRIGTSTQTSPAVITGPTLLWDKLTVVDSLRSNGPIVGDAGLKVTGSGFMTGNFNFGSTGAVVKEGSTGDVTLPSSGTRVNFSYVGDNWVGPTAAGGALALTSNGGGNKTVYLPGTGDEAQINGKGVVRDSLRVMMPLKLGQTSGVPQYHVIGDGHGTSADTLTVALNGTDISSQRGPKLMLQRNGSPHGVFQGGSLGPEIRVDQALGLIIGALGTNTPTFRFTMTSGTTGTLSVNKSGAAAGTLDVGGNGIFKDSLRVMMPLKLGQTSGVPQLHVIGDGHGAVADTVSVLLNGTNNSSPRSPNIHLQRDGTPVGLLAGHSSGMDLRWAQAKGLWLGALGTNTPTFRFEQTTGTTGTLAINKSSAASYTLDVNGTAAVSDSIRSNGPIIGDAGLKVTGSGFMTGNFNFGSTGTITKEGSNGNITLTTGGDRINFSFAGDNYIGPTVASGGLALTSNGGSNKTFYLPGAGDEAQVNGKLWVRDSMHVAYSPEFGYRDLSGADDTLRVGREMVLKKYGTTSDVFFANTGNGMEFTNDGVNFIRASDAAGSLSFQAGGSTTRLSIAADGDINVGGAFQFRLGSSTQAALPAHDNGSLIYCSDCTKGSVPCSGSGSGSVAKRENGAWNCD